MRHWCRKQTGVTLAFLSENGVSYAREYSCPSDLEVATAFCSGLVVQNRTDKWHRSAIWSL